MNTTASLSSPASAAASDRPRVLHTTRSRWPGWFFWLALVGVALMVGVAVLAANLSLPTPLTVRVDGQELFSGFQLGDMPPAHKVVLAGVILISLLAAAIVLPVALILGVVALMALLLVVVALPILAVVAVVALLMSPLLLLGWLVWRVVAG